MIRSTVYREIFLTFSERAAEIPVYVNRLTAVGRSKYFVPECCVIAIIHAMMSSIAGTTGRLLPEYASMAYDVRTAMQNA